MTRFHTKKSADKTLYKLKEVLDVLKYNFTVNSPRQVRFTLESFCVHLSEWIPAQRKLAKTDLEFGDWTINYLKWYYDKKNHFLFSSDFENVFA